nr:hypothetical protein Iba_chr07dCG12630 [Ipomoea batatas]
MGATSKKTPLLFILVLLIITFLFTFPCTAQAGRDSAVPMSSLIRCPWSRAAPGGETPTRPPGGGGGGMSTIKINRSFQSRLQKNLSAATIVAHSQKN